MIKNLILWLASCVVVQTVWAAPKQVATWPYPDLTPAQVNAEWLAVVTNLHSTIAWRTVVMQRMVEEANWAAAQLKLPIHYPIQAIDIRDVYICSPQSSVLPGTNRLYDIHIPREQRLRALQFGPFGRIATTNFEFGFVQGRLHEVMRLKEPQVEYYAHDLEKLVGKPSIIDTNGAYELATQWLAAVDVDMVALRKLKWTINQLHYKGPGTTNNVTLPLYYVDFGNKHYPANGNLHAYDKPLVSVELLGTTKELQDLIIDDISFSRRPLLLITNAIDLFRMPNPPVKRLQSLSGVETNSASP